MKDKIWICFTIFALVILNVSCNNKIESNNIGSAKSLNDAPESAAEDDPENYSIYENPIDKYFLPQIYSLDSSHVQMREARYAYKKAWKMEYRNVMKWLKKKCVYDEDKKNISLLQKNVAQQIEIEKEVLKTELINAYKVNPDPRKVENSCSRISLQGNGTSERLIQSEGELYRDVCMRILNLHGQADGEYEFKFRETDYMN